MTALERGPELGLAGQMGIRGGLKRGRLLVVVWGILGYLQGQLKGDLFRYLQGYLKEIY